MTQVRAVSKSGFHLYINVLYLRYDYVTEVPLIKHGTIQKSMREGTRQ